jgi:hypothetical protein
VNRWQIKRALAEVATDRYPERDRVTIPETLLAIADEVIH